MKILITGASKRIGKILTEHLAKQGHQMAIHYNNSSAAARQLLNDLGGQSKGHTIIQANLAVMHQTENLLTDLKQDWGAPDVLINNASTYFRRGMTKFTTEELCEDYTINFFSPLILMKEFRRLCQQGSVINFVDKRVNLVDPEAGPYALAKKSLRDATLACAQEWQGKVRVNAIAPGPILPPDESCDNIKKVTLDKLLNVVVDYINHTATGEVTIIE